MKYAIRPREDWILLGLIALLAAFAWLALREGAWPMALLAVAFASATAVMQWRMMNARWCSECQAQMRALAPAERDYETKRYVCDRCGRHQDSGVQTNWPD
ncbi:MAG: hypothetical protein RIC56_24135 [Pseudomonadales bacterium]